MAETWTGSPFPHQCPEWMRVSIIMSEKDIFSIDPSSLEKTPIPLLDP
jgi:hypothetical protein